MNRFRITIYTCFIYLFILVVESAAQHDNKLMVMPRHINFNSDFGRSQIVHATNNSNGVITIDSLTYNPNVYFVRLSRSGEFPITLNNNSEFTFEVIQYNYFNLQPSDSASTITIYNSSNEPVINLQTHHHQQMRFIQKGLINGTVKDSIDALANASLYFFYNQNLLMDSIKTDNEGYFNKELPMGEYFIAAKKEGYYLKYAFDNDSPLGADIITVTMNNPVTLNFILEKETPTNLNISGVVKDVENTTLKKAIVVVRKGKHTPTKLAVEQFDVVDRSYSSITDENGFYNLKNIKMTGEYYVQAFSSFNIPGYYNINNLPASLWQNADSVELHAPVDGINIILERDSSYGAGFVAGNIIPDAQSSSVNDAVIFVRSIVEDRIYTYNFVSSNGSFSVPVLPYGEYELLAQKIGVEDVKSAPFTISTIQDSVSGINLTMIITSLKSEKMPANYELKQNYPNPFNPATNIEFSISESGYYSMKIYNMIGEEVIVLGKRVYAPGTYNILLDASELASGVYIYQLSGSNVSINKKMILMK